jgi:hypothetical protein
MKIVGKSRISGHLIAKLGKKMYKVEGSDHLGFSQLIEKLPSLEDDIYQPYTRVFDPIIFYKT